MESKRLFCFICHITNTATNAVDFCVKTGSGRTGPCNVQLTVNNNNNNNKHFIYTRVAVNSCIVMYCMMCTFRVMLRPIL